MNSESLLKMCIKGETSPAAVSISYKSLKIYSKNVT
jgi:hypothetical protein